MTKKIILFNGPPGSGKDTAANRVQDIIRNAGTDKFAKSVKEGCHAMLGLVTDVGTPLPHNWFEKDKEKPLPEFGGFSPRQSYIWYSEEVMKPRFGNAIFGTLTVARLKKSQLPVISISDSGFIEEVDPLIDEFGAENVFLVRLHRTGHDFTNDSRSYLDTDRIVVKDIRNDGELDELGYDLVNALHEFSLPVRPEYGWNNKT